MVANPIAVHPSPRTAASHGDRFTEHIVSAEWNVREGWTSLEVAPLHHHSLHPGTAGLHYGQVVFEGLKAFRQPDRSIAVFRPRDNARRLQRSAARLCMPAVPEQLFLEAVDRLVALDGAELPAADSQSLYIRPLLYATDVNLMLKPAENYRFVVMAFVAGAFFGAGVDSIAVHVNRDYARAMPGGTGDVKIAGNYAPTFAAQVEAGRHGCQQVLWLDSAEHRWIEEMSGMNVFLVSRRGSQVRLITPPLTGTLLPGVTRDTILTLVARLGFEASEEPVSVDQWRSGGAQGWRYTEAFACGTAAVVTAIGEVRDVDGGWVVGDGRPGPVTAAVSRALTDVQRGRSADHDGWLRPVTPRAPA